MEVHLENLLVSLVREAVQSLSSLRRRRLAARECELSQLRLPASDEELHRSQVYRALMDRQDNRTDTEPSHVDRKQLDAMDLSGKHHLACSHRLPDPNR